LGEKKDLVRSFMAQGLSRDKCLAICGISKNQFYHKPSGGKRGRKKSKQTTQLVGGQKIKQNNKDVKSFIREAFENPQIDYGYHKMTSHLQLNGYYINHKKVYRLMKEARLLRVKPVHKAKNYVQYRIVCPEEPLRLMEVDIKQVWIQQEHRFAYVLTIIDVFTRVVLYWTCGYQMRQDQVQYAWQQIIEGYLQPLGVMAWEVDIEVRSDNGPQFCAKKIQDFLKKNSLLQTFTHPYTPQENGHIESFHAILGRSLQGQYFENLEMLINSLKQFYDFYNFERIHGSTVKLPPVTFWKQWDLNHIHRQVLDEKQRKVKFSLKIEKQRVQKVQLYLREPSVSGNRIQREVLSLNFLGVNLPENSNLSKQTAPN